MRHGIARAPAILASLWMLAVAAADGQPALLEPFALPAADLHARAVAMPKREDFAATFLIDDHHFELDDAGRITYRNYYVYRIDSEAAVVMFSQVLAQWDPSRQQRPAIRARVITTDGREHAFDPSTLGDEIAEDSDPRIFTDERILRGPLPAIALGSVVEIEIRIVDIEPPFGAGRSRDVYLAAGSPVEYTRIVVSAPASVALRHATRLLPDAKITDAMRDGRRLVTLEHGPLAIDFSEIEHDSMGDQPVWPQFLFSSGESWEAVARGYAGMAEPFVRTDEVRALLPSRLPDSREAKIATLLELVQERVRYTGVFFGTGKLVPNPPSVTLKRRFGDCKDMAVLLASLLRAVDIPAELVLLNADIGVDLDPELPGIGGFNHMIVRVPGENPLWIDPTVEHMKAGELPAANRGRWALVIGETGGTLERTPAARPGDQYEFIERELRLADSGPADLHVSVRANGSEARNNRRAWAERSAATDKQRDEQLKALYSAKSIAGFEFSDDAATGELTHRFEAHGVRSGHTYLEEAVIRESFVPMLLRIPYGLRLDDEALAQVEEWRAQSDRKQRARTADWIFEPFQTQWQWRIIPPRGYHSRPLPDDLDLRLGPARFTRQFELDAAGHVIASVSLDSGTGRYTVEEGEAFRSALLAHASAFHMELRFDHEAASFAAAGDEPAALRRHRELIASEPRNAVHLLRAAYLLLEYGLVTEARKYARQATVLEPDNALAFIHLGNALRYNEAGVEFGRGFDRDGAIRAYQEAIRLNPQNHAYHLQVGATAAYANDSRRFVIDADLELAISSYRKYFKEDPTADSMPWAIFTCLWELGRFDEILAEAARLPEDSTAQPIRLAARVMKVGAAIALSEEANRGSPSARRERIERAVRRLAMSRHYEQARELMVGLGSESSFSPGTSSTLMRLLQTTVRSENLPDPPATATGVAESLTRMALLQEPALRDLESLLSIRARGNGDNKWFAKYLCMTLQPPHEVLVRAVDNRRDVARDIALSNLEFRESEAPGDLRKVTVLLGGTTALTLFMVSESGSWRVLTLSAVWHPIGREVVERLDVGDAATARALIELAREESQRPEINGMSTWVAQFARVLPPNAQNPTEKALRLGALFLLVWPDMLGAGIDDIRSAEALAVSAEERGAWHWLLYAAAMNTGEYELMIDAARGIKARDPAMGEDPGYLVNAQQFAGRWSDVEAAGRAWFATQPNDDRALWVVVGALNAQGRSREGLELMKSLAQRGRTNPRDLMQLAWQALIADAVDDSAVQAAETAFNLQTRREFHVGHALACIYAVSGRVTEARKLASSLLEQHPEIDADSGEMWMIRGLVLEHLGETTDAARAYAKFERPQFPDPNSAFAVASTRLAKLTGK